MKRFHPSQISNEEKRSSKPKFGQPTSFAGQHRLTNLRMAEQTAKRDKAIVWLSHWPRMKQSSK